jgi:hypothetical protein
MLVPNPRTIRPPLIRSRSSALSAVSTGLRLKASATPEPIISLVLAIAAAANVGNGGEKSCGTHTPYSPRSSNSRIRLVISAAGIA